MAALACYPADSGDQSWQSERLRTVELGDAAALLAEAMADNPLHVAVFGGERPQRVRRLKRFFDILLPWVDERGSLRSLAVDGELIAVLGMLPVNACRPGHAEALELGLRWACNFAPQVSMRLLRWLSSWHRLDPSAPHCHLGPLAVKPGWQHRGIGSQLLDECCRTLDAENTAAWLETDRIANVRLYQRFGFTVASERRLLGVTNYFMWREPQPAMA